MDNITIIFKGGNAYACRGTALLLTFYLEVLDHGSMINKFDIDLIDAVYVNGVLIYLKGKRYRGRMDKLARSKTWTIIKVKDAIRYLFPEVKEMFYFIDNETKEEYVRLNCRNAKVGFYYFDVCVTADSPEAMFDDVWNKCKKVFM